MLIVNDDHLTRAGIASLNHAARTVVKRMLLTRSS